MSNLKWALLGGGRLAEAKGLCLVLVYSHDSKQYRCSIRRRADGLLIHRVGAKLQRDAKAEAQRFVDAFKPEGET